MIRKHIDSESQADQPELGPQASSCSQRPGQVRRVFAHGRHTWHSAEQPKPVLEHQNAASSCCVTEWAGSARVAPPGPSLHHRDATGTRVPSNYRDGAEGPLFADTGTARTLRPRPRLRQRHSKHSVYDVACSVPVLCLPGPGVTRGTRHGDGSLQPEPSPRFTVRDSATSQAWVETSRSSHDKAGFRCNSFLAAFDASDGVPGHPDVALPRRPRAGGDSDGMASSASPHWQSQWSALPVARHEELQGAQDQAEAMSSGSRAHQAISGSSAAPSVLSEHHTVDHTGTAVWGTEEHYRYECHLTASSTSPRIAHTVPSHCFPAAEQDHAGIATPPIAPNAGSDPERRGKWRCVARRISRCLRCMSWRFRRVVLRHTVTGPQTPGRVPSTHAEF
jgi:hypothetical protein